MLFSQDQKSYPTNFVLKPLVWFSARKFHHNTLENTLQTMATRDQNFPYLTNHLLKATNVTILLSNNVETCKIKAVTGH